MQPDSLAAAADQIDHMLGKTENGIAARMAEYGASMALYGPDENAYFIPKNIEGLGPDLYNSRRALGMWPNTLPSQLQMNSLLPVYDLVQCNGRKSDWTDGCTRSAIPGKTC